MSHCTVFCGSLLVLGACQSDHPAASVAVAAAPQPVVAAVARQVPPGPRPVRPTGAPKQTPFPDTLRPLRLEVTHWSDQELDSAQAHLDSMAVGGPAEAQYGRFRTIDFYDGTGTRFFYRESGHPTGWAELNLSYWLSEFNSLPFINAEEVKVDQSGSEVLLLRAGGGNYGSGGGETTSYTLLISLAGPPFLIWKSTDEYREEVKPTESDRQGEMIGGNYASATRDVTVRHGLVHVPRVKQEGKFASTDNAITPITPGYYRYQAGRFYRVAR